MRGRGKSDRLYRSQEITTGAKQGSHYEFIEPNHIDLKLVDKLPPEHSFYHKIKLICYQNKELRNYSYSKLLQRLKLVKLSPKAVSQSQVRESREKEHLLPDFESALLPFYIPSTKPVLEQKKPAERKISEQRPRLAKPMPGLLSMRLQRRISRMNR